MHPNPTQAVHFIFPNVRILARPKEMIAATATKTAVQVPWDDIAFSPIEVLSRPEPEAKIQSSIRPLECIPVGAWFLRNLTDADAHTEDLAAYATKH